jgi:TolB-like protein/DNA-binding winged helix-turn-helix (wHTH) protein/tetratricopeptide (TPR) repeat protein
MLGTLSGPGGTVHLEPKVMNVLVCLAELAGEVVTHDQFIARVWRGRVVSDEVLSRCISMLRTRLGDDPREPRFIQTLPKIGYRLVTPVEPLPARPAPPAEASQPVANATQPVATIAAEAPPVPRRRLDPRLLVGLTVLGLLLLGAATYFYLDRVPRHAAAVAGEPTIAVLPFVNRSDDKNNEYFSDGLTDEIIDRLANVPELLVVASTSAFALKDHSEDVRQIGERLGVRYLLEGSVRKEGDRVRITAQLVDTERGFHVWSKPFDTQLSDIFAVQDTIANGIVAELLPRLTGKNASQIETTPPTEVIAAYELLLQGRYHLKRREEAPIRRSIELFEQAIALDSGFGEAYRELARAYALLPYYSYEDHEEMSALAVQTIERGTVLDPTLARSAQDVLAFVHLVRWEWIEAERGFRQALLASPNDPDIHQWYSQLLARVGNAEQSLHHALQARKHDVLSPVVNDRLAVAYMWVDEDEQARRQFELADELGMGPTANPAAYVALLLRRGEYDKAGDLLIAMQKLFARTTDWVDPFIAALRDPVLRPAAREAVAKAARERSISPGFLFGAWVYLGDADAAMEVAFELLHDPARFGLEFLFARETSLLRRHPRFAELVTEIGLDRYWDKFGWPAMCARRGDTIECR